MNVWRHKKTGGLYVILGHCRIEAGNVLAIRYRAIGGKSIEWVRPNSEFYDGRFEQVQIKEVE